MKQSSTLCPFHTHPPGVVRILDCDWPIKLIKRPARVSFKQESYDVKYDVCVRIINGIRRCVTGEAVQGNQRIFLLDRKLRSVNKKVMSKIFSHTAQKI